MVFEGARDHDLIPIRGNPGDATAATTPYLNRPPRSRLDAALDVAVATLAKAKSAVEAGLSGNIALARLALTEIDAALATIAELRRSPPDIHGEPYRDALPR